MVVEVGEERGLVVLAAPKACQRAPGPALRGALSASSLTESLESVWDGLRDFRGGAFICD